MKRLLPIVEGHGEIKAVPLLIRRILVAQEVYEVDILPPRRYGEYPPVAKNFDNCFQAANKENAPILWIMDFDSKLYECPVQEASNLLNRAAELRPSWPLKIAFFVKEYETFFLIDEAASRAVFPDIPSNIDFPEAPEDIRDAKGWLSQHRPTGLAYKETVHQEKITARLNLELLRARSPDFAHLVRAIVDLVHSDTPT